FNKELKTIGEEFKVNTVNIAKNENTYFENTKTLYISPQVISNNDGFVISWTNNEKLYLRKYDINGNADKSEINPEFNIKGTQSDVLGSKKIKNIINIGFK
ncbi:MAG: hypothetical protein ACK44D_00690, partial [Bacteroidia bacterium]